MHEALKKTISDRKTITDMEVQNKNNLAQYEANIITTAFNGASEIANKAIGTYAQSEMRKDAPALSKGLEQLADEYINVDDPESYQKFTDARKNYIDNYLQGKNALFRGIFNEQFRANYEDDAYSYFDKKFTTTISEKNIASSSKIMEDSVTSFVNGEDLSKYDNPVIYKTVVDSDGIHVVQEAVTLDNLWDTNTGDEKVDSFNHLLNIQYEAAALAGMTTDKAKVYVEEQIPTIESKVVTNEILSMAETMVKESNMTETQIANKIMSMYGDGTDSSNYFTPYTKRELTPEESKSYRDIAQKAVSNAWDNMESYYADVYNEKLIPALEAIEATCSYITSEVFNGLIDSDEIAIDRRFIKSTLAKWDTLLQTNDAMYALDDWFKNGQPMDDSLTSYMNNYVYKDSASNSWMYTNSAGFITMSGFTDKTLQQNTNRAIEEDNVKVGEQMLNNYYDVMVAYTDFKLGNATDDNPIQREYLAQTEGKDLTDEEKIKIKNDIEFGFLSSAYTQYWKGKSLGASSSEIDDKLSAYRSTYTAGAQEIEAMNNAKAEQERAEEAERLGLYDSYLNSQALAIEDSNGLYLRNSEYSYGKNMVVGKALYLEYESLKNSGADMSAIFDSYSKDPLAKGLTNDQKQDVDEYAEEKDIPYVFALLDLGYYSDADFYTLGYDVLSKMVAMKNGVSDLDSIDAYTQKSCLDARYIWQQQFAAECADYENAVGVYNGELTAVASKDEDGNTIYTYVKAKPSKTSTSSSTSSGSLNVYGGAQGRLEKAKTAMQQEAEYTAYPNEEIPGVLEGLFSLFGKENENGHVVTLEDIRMLARSNVLTQEQKKMVDTISTTDLGNLLFEGNRFNRLMDAIDNDGFSELKKEQYLLSAIEYLDDNYATTENIDKLVEEVVDLVTNSSWRDFVNALRGKGDDFSALFSTSSGELKDDLLGLISGYSNARIAGTDDHAIYLGYNRRADEVVNQGLSTSFSNLLPDDFVALWASDDLVEIWKDEKKVLKACLEAGFYFIGKESMFNSNTNIDEALAEWRTMFNEDGTFRYTDESKEMAGVLYDAFQFAGQFYSLASAFKKLNASELNLGTVEAVNGNTFYMSSGATVKVRQNNSGKSVYEVWNTAGTVCENVDTFFSNSYLEGVSKGYSDGLNDREDYYISARTAEGNNQPVGGYASAEEAKTKMDSAYGSLWTMATEYSSNIDFSDNHKITDGQADMSWAEEFGYKPPQLYTGWSMNGYRYNYRITTDANMTFESEPPKSMSLANAVWEMYKLVASPMPVPEYATMNGIQLNGNLVSFGGI